MVALVETSLEDNSVSSSTLTEDKINQERSNINRITHYCIKQVWQATFSCKWILHFVHVLILNIIIAGYSAIGRPSI